MGIVDDDIGAVRAATDLVAVVTQYTQLKRSGRRWVGLCPFHAEKTPSFSVNQELGLYRCFGCQASGDAITFVREAEHLDFVGAVELLAGRAGVTLRYTEQREGESRKRRARLVEAIDQAVAWYHDRLLSAPDAAATRRYLRERGLTSDDVRAFRLGWAPEGWDELCRALRLPPDVLRDTGLGYLNRRQRPTDTFRARILFPIFDANGDAVGFGGRVLPGADGPKYKNSPESPVYQKSKVLYALNWSKSRIVSDDRTIVCEGYTDVIGFARVGLPAAVATCGTALTEDHVRLLRRYARTLVLAFDADAAGQAAADRFYQWEREHELQVKVAVLPPGVDPGQLSVDDPAALVAAVEGAVEFLRFRVERVLASGDLSSVEGRARTAEAALEVIGEHPDPLVRDAYLMQVADRCRIEPDQLRAVAGRGPRAAATVDAGRRIDADRGPELEVLRHVVHSWEEVEGWVHPALFADDLHAAAFDALMAHATVPDAIAAAAPTVAELLSRLATEDTDSDPFDAVVRLVTESARREVAVLARRPEPDVDLLRRQQELTRLIDELRHPVSSRGAAERLVTWLGSGGEERA